MICLRFLFVLALMIPLSFPLPSHSSRSRSNSYSLQPTLHPSSPLVVCLSSTDSPLNFTTTLTFADNHTSSLPFGVSLACLSGDNCLDVTLTTTPTVEHDDHRRGHEAALRRIGKETASLNLGATGWIGLWEVSPKLTRTRPGAGGKNTNTTTIDVHVWIKYGKAQNQKNNASVGPLQCGSVLVWEIQGGDGGGVGASKKYPVIDTSSSAISGFASSFLMPLDAFDSGQTTTETETEKDYFDVLVQPGNRISYGIVIGSIAQVQRCSFVGEDCVSVWNFWEFQDSNLLDCSEGVNRCRFRFIQEGTEGVTAIYCAVVPAGLSELEVTGSAPLSSQVNVIAGYPFQITLVKDQALSVRVSGGPTAQVAITRIFGGGSEGDEIHFGLYDPSGSLHDSDVMLLNKDSSQYSAWLDGTSAVAPSSVSKMWTLVVQAKLEATATVMIHASKAGHFDIVNGYPFVLDEKNRGPGPSSKLYFRNVVVKSGKVKAMASDMKRVIYADTKPYPSSSKPAHEAKGIVDFNAAGTLPAQLWYYSLSSDSRPFVFSVVDALAPIRLLNQKPMISDVGIELYQYFVFKIPDGPMPDVSITVSPYQADPDLYVARTVFPTKSNYDWSSSQAGTYQERIIVPSDDKKLNMGTWAFTGYFLVGIYRNYKDPTHDTPCPQYSILADFSVPSMRLIDGVKYVRPLSFGDRLYFRRRFDCASEFSFSAYSEKDGCYVQLYAAQGYVPTETYYDATTATFERTAVLSFPPFAGEFVFLVVGKSLSSDNCTFVISSSQNTFTLGPIGQSKYSYCRTSVAGGFSALCEVLPGWGPSSTVPIWVDVAVETGNTSLYVQQGSPPTPKHYTAADESYLGNSVTLSVNPSQKTYVLVEAAVDSRIAVSLSLEPSVETCLWVDIPQFFAGSTAKALVATTDLFVVADPLKLLMINRNASEVSVAVSQPSADFSASATAGWYETTSLTLTGYAPLARLQFSFTCKPGNAGGEKCPFSGLLQPEADPSLILHNELMIVDKTTSTGLFWFLSSDTSPSSSLRVFSCEDGATQVHFEVVDVEGRLPAGIIGSVPSARGLHIAELTYPFRPDTRYNVSFPLLQNHVAAFHLNVLELDPFRTDIALESVHSSAGTRLFIYQGSAFDPSDDVEFLVFGRHFSTSITLDDLTHLNFEFCSMKSQGSLLGSAEYDPVKQLYAYEVPTGYGFGSALIVVPRSSRLGTSDRLLNVPMPLFFRFGETQTFLFKKGESFVGIIPGFDALCKKSSLMDVWAIVSGDIQVLLRSEHGKQWKLNGSSVYSVTFPLEDIMLKTGCSRLSVNLTALENSKVYFRVSLRSSGMVRSFDMLPGIPLTVSVTAFEDLTLNAAIKEGATAVVKIISLRNSVDVLPGDVVDWDEDLHFATVLATPKDGSLPIKVRGTHQMEAVFTAIVKDVDQTNEEILAGSSPSPVDLGPSSSEYYQFTSLGTSSLVSLSLFHPADVTFYASATVRYPSKSSHTWTATFTSVSTASLLISSGVELFADVFVTIVSSSKSGISGHILFSSSIDTLPMTLIDGVPLLFSKPADMRHRSFRVVREPGDLKLLTAQAWFPGKKEMPSLDLDCSFGSADHLGSVPILSVPPVPSLQLSECKLDVSGTEFDGYHVQVTLSSSSYDTFLFPHQTSFFLSVATDRSFIVHAKSNASVVALPRAGSLHLSGFGLTTTDDSFALLANGLPPRYERYPITVINPSMAPGSVEFAISFFSDTSQGLNLMPDHSELLLLRSKLELEVGVTQDQKSMLLQIVPTNPESVLTRASLGKTEMSSIAGSRVGIFPANATNLVLRGAETFMSSVFDLSRSQYVPVDEFGRPIRVNSGESIVLRLFLLEDVSKVFFEVDVLVGEVILLANSNSTIPTRTSFEYRIRIGIEGNGLLVLRGGDVHSLSGPWTVVLENSEEKSSSSVLRYGAYVSEGKLGSGLRGLGRIESLFQADIFSHKPKGDLYTFLHFDEMSLSVPERVLHPNQLFLLVNNGSQFVIQGSDQFTTPYIVPVTVYEGEEVLIDVQGAGVLGSSGIGYSVRMLSSQETLYLEDSSRGVLLPYSKMDVGVYTNSQASRKNASLYFEMCGGFAQLSQDEQQNHWDCKSRNGARLSDLLVSIHPVPKWMSQELLSICVLEVRFPALPDTEYFVSSDRGSTSVVADPFFMLSYVYGPRNPSPFDVSAVSRQEMKWSGFAQSTFTSSFEVEVKKSKNVDDEEASICSVDLWIVQCVEDPMKGVLDSVLNFHTPCAIRESARRASDLGCIVPRDPVKMNPENPDDTSGGKWTAVVRELIPARFSYANAIVSVCGEPYRTEIAGVVPLVFEVDRQSIWYGLFGGIGAALFCALAFGLVLFCSFLVCCLRARIRNREEYAHSINVRNVDFDAGGGEYLPLNPPTGDGGDE